jgi:outer membrane protein TolC
VKKYCLAVVLLLVGSLWRQAQGEALRWTLSLQQALEASLDTSAQWKSARSAASAAEDQALAQRGALMPRLSIDGSYRYLAEIPAIQVSPQFPAIPFTTHNQYSLGPEIDWTAFSGGALVQAWRAAQANAHAQERQADAIRRQIRLAARLAYFQAQLASEQVRLYAESYHVEQSQYHDIEVRYHAGQSARVDLLAAEQDLLTRQKELLQGRTNLAAAIRELTSLTRLGETLDPSWPLGKDTVLGPTPEMPAPTLIMVLDSAATSYAQMEPAGRSPFDARQPSLAYLSELAEAARRTAKLLAGGHWPTLSVLANVMREYPNGPIPETVTQKTFGVNLSFPLFAGGSTLYAARAQDALARSNEEKREQTARDLLDSWQKSRDAVESLRLQGAISHRSAERAAEVARLRYQAYTIGQLRYLDVEDANLRELQAKVDAATTDVNLLVQLANLESLSEERGSSL